MTMLIPITIFNRTIKLKVLHILLLLLAIGAFIRFHNLTYSSLWLDEIFSMRGASPESSLQEVYEYSKHDQPPVFFFLLNLWLKLFGYTDFAGRAITCLYGLMGIAAMFFLGREVKNEKLGLMAALVTTINWFHTDISKEIRFYPLVFFLAAMSYLFFLRSIKKTRPTDLLLYSLFTAVLLNTHYYGLVLFVSQLLIFILVVIFYKREPRLIIGGLLAGILSGLSLVHWLPVFLSDLQISSFHVKAVKWDFPFQFAWSYVREPVAFAIYIISFFLITKKLIEKIRKRSFPVEALVIGGWIFFGFMIPLIYSWVRFPLLTGKYATIVVPAMFLIFSYGFITIRQEKIRSYCILAMFLSAIVVLFFARPPYKPRRGEDWREVGMYFSAHPADKQVIFSQLAWFHEYYFRKYDLTSPVDQNLVNFDSLASNTDQLWLFVSNRYTGGWPVNGFLPKQQEYIDRNFDVKDTLTFKQTSAFYYERKRADAINPR